jgi:hypothetical protein
MAKGKLIKCKVAELVYDFTLYPRLQLDSVHVGDLWRAFESGIEFAPLIVWAKNKKVVDGFHRGHMFAHHFGPNYEVECIAKDYANDAEFLRDSVRYAGEVRKKLAAGDRTRIILLYEKVGLDPELVAKDLHMTLEAVGELRADRVGMMRVANKNEPIPLKRTIEHMAGKTLTKGQAEANERLGGMRQLFYVNQVIHLIENDLLEPDNPKLAERLRHLGELIGGLKV